MVKEKWKKHESEAVSFTRRWVDGQNEGACTEQEHAITPVSFNEYYIG